MFRKLKIAFYAVIGLMLLPFVAVAAFFAIRMRQRQLIRSAVRTSRDGIQTATLTFEKPDQNQTVKLFGMIHVGQPGYYEEIGQVLQADEDAGARILYERVQKPTDEEVEQLSKNERRVYYSLKNIGSTQTSAANMLGLVHQMDALEPKESWHNTDCTQLDLIRLIVQGRLTNFVVRTFGAARGTGGFGSQAMFTMLNYVLGRAHILMVVIMALLVLPKYAKLKSFILDHRNVVGHEGIMEALREYNRVDATWGAAHLPGMSAMLEKEGFALTNTEWRTAFTFEQKSFVSVARAAVNHFWTKLREEFSLTPTEEDEAEAEPETETENKK